MILRIIFYVGIMKYYIGRGFYYVSFRKGKYQNFKIVFKSKIYLLESFN